MTSSVISFAYFTHFFKLKYLPKECRYLQTVNSVLILSWNSFRPGKKRAKIGHKFGYNKLFLEIYVVVQFLPLVQFFLNQYKIFEQVQNILNQYKNILNWFNFFFFCFWFCVKQKKSFWHLRSLSSLFSSSLLYLPHLLFPPCSPSIPASILFISMLTL